MRCSLPLEEDCPQAGRTPDAAREKGATVGVDLRRSRLDSHGGTGPRGRTATSSRRTATSSRWTLMPRPRCPNDESRRGFANANPVHLPLGRGVRGTGQVTPVAATITSRACTSRTNWGFCRTGSGWCCWPSRPPGTESEHPTVDRSMATRVRVTADLYGRSGRDTNILQLVKHRGRPEARKEIPGRCGTLFLWRP